MDIFWETLCFGPWTHRALGEEEMKDKQGWNLMGKTESVYFYNAKGFWEPEIPKNIELDSVDVTVNWHIIFFCWHHQHADIITAQMQFLPQHKMNKMKNWAVSELSIFRIAFYGATDHWYVSFDDVSKNLLTCTFHQVCHMPSILGKLQDVQNEEAGTEEVVFKQNKRHATSPIRKTSKNVQ